MSALLSCDSLESFQCNGFVVVPDFYDLYEIESIQRTIYSIIGLVIQERGLSIKQQNFTPETFDSGFQELITHDRALGGRVYDAVKQIPAFVRLVACEKHEAIMRQVRDTDQPAIAAGGYGIRIDNPGEEKFRAGWHQDYPAQIRSLDGIVFWSPLIEMIPELGPVEFCLGSHKDGLAPVCETDEMNPEKTGAYGLTLSDEENLVGRYEKAAPLTKPSDLVLIDFLTLHRSGKNVSARARWSLQMRWFNFSEPTGKRLGWPGVYSCGSELRAVHPEMVVD